jgi:poly(3-hydroxybutyrate) depolymerase
MRTACRCAFVLTLPFVSCAGFPAGTPSDAATPAADSVHPNSPPRLSDPGPQQVAEEQTLDLPLLATDPDGDPVRLLVSGLPDGAFYDAGARRLRYTPDFIQGGRTWPVTLTASDGQASTSVTFPITVLDTIAPPPPQVTHSETVGAWQRLSVAQRTDAYLDSSGYAGRVLTAVVTAPVASGGPPRLPLRVLLHGFDGTPATDGWEGEVRIMPADAQDTYWWGYSDRLPAGPINGGTVPPYTLRRVLNLIDWALRSFPAIDPERIYLDGASMGGAGAATLGLLYARHFCWVQATIGQAIPRNHRPARIAQLSGLWGTPQSNLDGGQGVGVWDYLDLTRVLAASPEARNQFLFLHHGKDDTTIHFGAVVMQSPVTGRTYYDALQQAHVGHMAVWDEGGHGINDPVLPDGWWQAGWNPVFDDTAYLRLHQAFPAFSRCSSDRNAGSGHGNGRQSWNEDGGYAGKVEVAGDTGWDGELAGAHNRGLRWDARRIVDTADRLEMPLRVLDGAGAPPPRPGYPTLGDKLDGTLPVYVDVTPRRMQRFQCRPGETVAWDFGDQHGTVTADAEGAVTVPAVALTTSWQTLVLRRRP